MKITKDRLPEGYIYPCSIREIRKYLEEIPKEDLEGIRGIRLSNRQTTTEGGFLPDGRMEIIYFVDKHFNKILNCTPSKKIEKKWQKFGGRIGITNGKYHISWSQGDIKRYIKFLLFHEIGHNVYRKKYGQRKVSNQEEIFCDKYAVKFL